MGWIFYLWHINDTFYSLTTTPAAKISLKTNQHLKEHAQPWEESHEWPGAKKKEAAHIFKWGLTTTPTNIYVNKFIVIFNTEHNDHRSRSQHKMEFAEKTPRR